MLKFLVYRPIGVVMTYLALVIMGIISSSTLPVSLLPDVNVPYITVQVSQEGYSAREMENLVAKRLRGYLRQCHDLEDIESQSWDGYTRIQLRFKFGSNIDYNAIDVNEKIDRAMGGFPDGVERPRVIKASATDIPIMHVNISVRENQDKYDFLQLSNFVNHVIRKKLEHLKAVALVDVTGMDLPQIVIRPKGEVLKSMGVDMDLLGRIFQVNNMSIGGIRVKEGQFEFNIFFSTQLRSIDELKETYLNVGGKVLKLKELADIYARPRKKQGRFIVNGQRGVSLAIIKKSNEQMETLKKGLAWVKSSFVQEYPELNFHYAQDQSKFLELTINNLKTTLLVGGILAFLVVFLFLSSYRLPIIIALTIPVSVIISLLFFMLLGISINIISLSGLILGIGLMIDNSIIVIDNITQSRERGLSVSEACVEGTQEVIRPMLSSALTTSAVFLPLIFISGLAGALFYDQAITVSIGLGVSYIVSITLLPVVYRLLYLRSEKRGAALLIKRSHGWLDNSYHSAFNFIMKYRWPVLILSFVCICSVYFLFLKVNKETFPKYPKKDTMLHWQWKENVHLDESERRLKDLIQSLPDNLIVQYNGWLGRQDYLISSRKNENSGAVSVYFDTPSPEKVEVLKRHISDYMKRVHPNLAFGFTSPDNVFEKTFVQNLPPFIIKLHQIDALPNYSDYEKIVNAIRDSLFLKFENPFEYQNYLSIEVDYEKLLIYEVRMGELKSTLESLFEESSIGTIKTSAEVIPVVIAAGEKGSIFERLKHATVFNQNKVPISLKSLIKVGELKDFKTIQADKNTEYIPVVIHELSDQLSLFEKRIQHFIRDYSDIQYSFDGGLYEFDEYLSEFLLVMLISLALLYFILAAQFESFLQPLIILFEIPIDVAGTLLVLWLTGYSLNVMSAIGMIVMTGIIINDSILKIDTINFLRRQERMSILKAIQVGGQRRLRPIIMTSLTTILAMIPVLLNDDLGSTLQKPLAIAVAGGLGIGTLVSLFFIPLGYWLIYRNSEKLSAHD